MLRCDPLTISSGTDKQPLHAFTLTLYCSASSVRVAPRSRVRRRSRTPSSPRRSAAVAVQPADGSARWAEGISRIGPPGVGPGIGWRCCRRSVGSAMRPAGADPGDAAVGLSAACCQQLVTIKVAAHAEVSMGKTMALVWVPARVARW